MWFHKVHLPHKRLELKIDIIISSDGQGRTKHAGVLYVLNMFLLQIGRPLNVHFFGGMNLPELYKHISPERHWQTVLVNAESLTREILPASSKAAGRTIDQGFVIVDLKGFG